MKRTSVLLLALAVAGCGTTADLPPRPETATPAAWVNAPATDQSTLPDRWWEVYEAPALDALIGRALDNNPDLEASRHRITAARAQARAAGAGLFPTLDASSGGGRSWPGQGKPGNSFRGAFDAAYEVDLWGGVGARADAAQASALGAGFERDAAVLSLSADVATTWFQMLSLNDRLANAQRILGLAEDTLALVETQESLGAASGLEVAQQRGNVASLRAQIPQLEQRRAETRNALAQFLGTTPGEVAVVEGTLAAVRLPEVAAGLPSSLLARRPDLRAAEARIAAAGADVQAARAAMLPSLRLTGGGGWSSSELSSLFTPGGFLANLASGLAAPIFDGGRLRAQRDQAAAGAAQAEAGYRGAVVAAFRDVEDALAAGRYLAEVEAAQAEGFARAREAHDIAAARYRAGRTDFLSLLDAQRTLFQQEEQLAQTRLARLNSTVALSKALGGGWAR